MCEVNLKIKDKVAIVTGAGRGIGQAISLCLAAEGADIVATDIDSETAGQTARQVESLGRSAIGLGLDVTDPAQVEDLVNKTLDKFKKIDILVNNAGITRDALIVRMKDEDWESVLNVNLKGAFNCIRVAARVMMKQRSGKIVNISSIIGLMGNLGQANYAASKAGLIGLTKSAAKELASRQINVNAIAPGFIQTKMTEILADDVRDKMLEQIPLKRFGQVEDVARLVLFLCGPDSDYITGQVIQVDGGMLM